jgi:hypothetical protein
MNARVLASLLKDIQRHVPQSIIKGRLVALCPYDQILRGVYFATSGDKAVFFLEAFIQPLYVPAEHFYFNLGVRLKTADGRERWRIGQEDMPEDVITAIHKKGLPFIGPIDTPQKLADWVERMGEMDDYCFVEARAYSLVAAGDFKRAVRPLERIIEILDSTEIPWAPPRVKLAREMLHLCKVAPQRATNVLDTWRETTITRLKL